MQTTTSLPAYVCIISMRKIKDHSSVSRYTFVQHGTCNQAWSAAMAWAQSKINVAKYDGDEVTGIDVARDDARGV